MIPGRHPAALPPTPVLQAGDNLWLKVDSLQPTGSFKVRGFLGAVHEMGANGVKAGIATVSSGNAALAAAYAARRVGTACRVVMFESAPAAKRDGVAAMGAEIIAWPRDQVLDWMAAEGWRSWPERFIHPFADPLLWKGHGTLAEELLRQVPDVERVIVPVGGGGLITGIARAFRAAGAAVEVVGVQSSGYPLWIRTITNGAPPQLAPVTIADGTTAPYEEPMHAQLSNLVDRWIEVAESDVRRAVSTLAIKHKVVAEGAGALAFAAASQMTEKRQTVAVVSGGNIDAARLAELLRE